MNKQRKVLITITYNEMGIIIDTKAEEVAQPEPKKGEWILYDKRFLWRTDYKCTNCGNYLDFSGVNGGRGEANFCPSCGADMRGEQDE